MSRNGLLFIDGLINLGLGVALLIFPRRLFDLLGLPPAASAFYPGILGAVLFGIGVALLLQRHSGGGLGLRGAVSINLSGGIVLAGWLLLGGLDLPIRGRALLWGLVALLVGVSALELRACRNAAGETHPSL